MILIVDDDAFMTGMLEDYIAEEGFECKTFNSSPDALEFYKDHTSEIEYVVSDGNMPIMSGPEMVKKILEINPKASGVFVSGEVPSVFEGLPFKVITKGGEPIKDALIDTIKSDLGITA